MKSVVSIAARSLFLRVLIKAAIVVGVIEIVFLAERLTGTLETVLANGGTVDVALILLLLTAPEIFDFALALACVIGGYFAFVAAREERELVALSAAGVSQGLAVRVALAFGVVAFAASLGVSGFLDPLARNVNRAAVFDLKRDLLFSRITEPSEGTLIETIRDKTFAALSDTGVSPPHESLFVHQPGGGGHWRVTQASDGHLVGPDDEGSYSLGLRRVIAYDFVPVDTALERGVLRGGRGPNLRALANPDIAQVPRLPRVQVQNVSVPVSLANVLRHVPREEVAREWTLMEAIERRGEAQAAGVEAREISGERFARALCAFLAPLIALLACTFASGGFGRYLALPLACTVLLALDVVARTVIGGLAATSVQAALVVGLPAAIGLALLLSTLVGMRAPTLLRPVSERT